MEIQYDEAVNLANQANAKDTCIPLFYTRAVQNNHASEIHGRPVFDDTEFVKIIIPGDNKNVPDRPVKEEDQKRWPEQWKKFLEGQEEHVGGTPLSEWPYLKVSRIAELKARNFLNVEAVASCADESLPNIGMDGREVRNRARQFLQGDDDTQKELRAKIAESDAALENAVNRVAVLEAEIERLDAMKDKRTAPKK